MFIRRKAGYDGHHHPFTYRLRFTIHNLPLINDNPNYIYNPDPNTNPNPDPKPNPAPEPNSNPNPFLARPLPVSLTLSTCLAIMAAL